MTVESVRLSPKRRAKFLFGGALVAIAVPALIVWGLSQPGSTSFYLTVSEVRSVAASAHEEYRVSGKVISGSIERRGLETRFRITDGKDHMRVVTAQPLPDAFKNGSEVVVRGNFSAGRFTASEVLAKCPSKFKAKRAS